MKHIMKRDLVEDYDTSIEEAFGVNDGQVSACLSFFIVIIFVMMSYLTPLLALVL